MAQQTFGSIIKTVSATGTPEALGTSATRAHSVTFLGLKAARTNNAGKVWVSPNSGNDTAAAVRHHRDERSSGGDEGGGGRAPKLTKLFFKTRTTRWT